MDIPTSAPPPARFVQSETNPDVLYKVTPLWCQCPSWRFQPRGRHWPCKHMVKEFGLPAPTATCVRCGERYPYNDASLLTRLCCPACRRFPMRAAHGWERGVVR